MISVCIPTRSGGLTGQTMGLLRSLERQTNDDFEILLAFDGETNEHIVCHGLRAFQCQRLHDKDTDSLVPDQVMFREAKGDIILHLDDDGPVTKRLVACVKELTNALPGCAFYGQIYFLDPVTMEVLQKDFPTRSPAVMPRLLAIGPEHACGAIWAAPTKAIRAIGGHDMRDLGWRGCDARLGYRLARAGLKQYLVGDEAMRFYHFGKTKTMEATERGDMDFKFKEHRHPAYHPIDYPTIANGGEQFWQPKNFPIKYREL